MSHRLIYEALSELVRRVETLDSSPGNEEEPFDLMELDRQIKRLSREVYKANMLSQTQADQTRQALDSAQQALESLNQERDKIARTARYEVIRALLPVLDGIEAGITSGAVQVKALLPSAPDAARILVAWLSGQRLLRERLLKLLEAEGVRPMLAVGQPFDPYKHIAVKTAQDPAKAEGLVIAEERRGYLHGDDVLRYADVVVNKIRSGAAS
jgi:molecular chaperone GrpE